MDVSNPPNSVPLSLSIVIPTFRREAYLAPLFQALAAQVESLAYPAEVVLVDNSPEGSAAGVARPGFVRYVHEPHPGVARARNRGVTEARGSHVVFLDDDERPAPGWLAAFAAVAPGAGACFGAVEPQFECDPPPALRQPLERLFSRRLPVASGADVSGLRAYLGSGNSMFERALLSRIDPPFDISFDSGGEDVWLFRQLVDDHGVALIWCPEALVHEIVPAPRATMHFLRRRRFSDGQLRCLIESGAGGVRGAARVGFWMAAGAAQGVLCGLGALAARPVSAALSVRLELAATGGAGKVLWWWRKRGEG